MALYNLNNINNGWGPILSSVDGSRLLLVSLTWPHLRNNTVLMSSDYGQSWNTLSPGTITVRACAGSSDLSTIVLCDFNSSLLHISKDFGSTWFTAQPFTGTFNSNSDALHNVACSADGSYIIFCGGGPNSGDPNAVYISNDGGSSWNQALSSYSEWWNAAACSSDGRRIIVCSSAGDQYNFPNGHIYISNDFGSTWQDHSPYTYLMGWNSVACDEDGSTIIVSAYTSGGGYGGPLYISSDFGATWTSPLPGSRWISVASNATGSTLLATVEYPDGHLYASNNFGVTWENNDTNNMYECATNGDGSHIVATVYNGSTYGGTPIIFPNFNDCLMGSATNLTHVILNNCALSTHPSGSYSILTNCQTGWSQPSAPAWNGSRAAYLNAILAAGVLSGSGHPEPGYGYPSYEGYETDLWGGTRTGIGAVTFTVPTTTHAPGILTVFRDCLLGSLSDIDHAELHNCSFSDPPTSSTLVSCQSGWNQPPVPTWDGPRAGFNNSILAAGVLYGAGNPEPGVGYPLYTDYPTGLWGTPRTGIGAVDFVSTIFNDCLLGSLEDLDGCVLFNCALNVPPETGGTLINCQIGWIQPPVPTWDGDRALFNDFILAAGVVAPPEPGVGYPSYPGYPTGLWGTPRLGIGAVDFFGATTTTSPVIVTYTNSTSITVTQYQVKLSGAMTCIGWIKSMSVEDGDSIIPLAISDHYGNVLNTDAALRFEILRQGSDYRLQYLGSKTKPIDRNLKIKINDGNWHMLSYESDANGNMTYSVDGIFLPTEDGTDQYGLPYSVAKSLSSRVGGGTVWSPFLYKTRQIIYMYNWRFGKNFNLGLKWIGELMNIDKNSLGIS